MCRMPIGALLVAFLAQFTISSKVPAEDVNPSEFFKVAYRAQRAERDRIKTWAGKLRCLEMAYFPNPPKYIEEKLKAGQRVAFREIRFDSEFFVDVTGSRLFSTFQPTEKIQFLDVDGAVLANTDERAYTNRALIGERALMLRPWQSPGRQAGDPKTDGWKAYRSRVIESSSREKAAERVTIGDIVDPMELFTPPASKFFGYLRLLSEVADADYFTSLKLRQEATAEGNVFVWGSGDPPSRYTAEYRIADYAGYHLVGYRLYDEQEKRQTCEVTIEYDRVTDVIVPRKYEFIKMSSDGEHLENRRSYELSEQILNQPPDESLFTMKHLGGKPGDRVIDAESGTLKMINGDLDVVSVADFERAYASGFTGFEEETPRRTRVLPRNDRRWWIFGLNGIVVGGLALWLIRVRRGGMVSQ